MNHKGNYHNVGYQIFNGQSNVFYTYMKNLYIKNILLEN